MKTSENNLATKDMINLVGPSAVGKTSLINNIDSKYHNFGRVVSYTTRAKRQGEPEDTYRFIDPASIDLALLMDNSVQFDRFPDSDIIYGTQLQDYRNKYNLLDTLSSSVEKFRDLGFAACRQFIIVTSPVEWQHRIDERHFAPNELGRRYKEAVNSLNWSIKEEDAVKWIYNANNRLPAVAKKIVNLSAKPEQYSKYNDSDAKEIGKDLLKYIQFLRNH